MSIFKNSFTQEVRGQLEARGQAIKNRTREGMIYFNSRNAWVRMSSGVDVEGAEGYSDKTAKENILFGGLLSDKGTLRAGLGAGKAYSATTNGETHLTGIKPMPGITQVEIQSKSAYGSLRQATVNFVCHDIKQLELMELLYMRPGFIVLLEFGWAPYLDNAGNLKNTHDFYDDIWRPSSPDVNLQNRFKKLFQRSKDKFGNYDALLGYVKNYEWSSRADGGYDCRTEIITIGEIIESLKVNYVPSYIPISSNGMLCPLLGEPGQKAMTEFGPKIRSFYDKNILAGICAELKYFGLTASGGQSKDSNSGYSINIDDRGSLTGLNNYRGRMFRITIEEKGGMTSETITENFDSDEQVYIDLETFIHILNKWVLVQDKVTGQPICQISLKSREYNTEEETQDLLCLSHPLQISVDPTICLIHTENYFQLKEVSLSTDGEVDLPIPADVMELHGLAYKTIKEYNNYSTYKETNENRAANVIVKYFSGADTNNLRRYGRALANAFEDYKQKTLRISRNTKSSGFSYDVGMTYEVGDKLLYYKVEAADEEMSSDAFTKEQSKAKSSILTKTFYDLLVDDLYRNDDDTLYRLMKNFKEFKDIKPEETLGTAQKLFIADSGVTETAKNNINSKMALEENNNRFSATGDTAEKTLTFLRYLSDRPYFQSTSDGKEFGRIGNIFINLGYALRLSLDNGLENQDNKEKREINLYDYLKTLMRGVQESIGSLNNFDIHVDPVDSIARIVDLHYIDGKSTRDAYNNAFTFLSPQPYGSDVKLDGLFNNIRNYKFTSQIFKEQSAIVAISAQNGGGQMGLDNETLVGWNQGLKDRILPEKNAPNAPSHSTVEGRIQALYNISGGLRALHQYIIDLGWIGKSFKVTKEIALSDRVYHSDESDRYKNSLRDMIMASKALSKTDASFKSIIPTKLSVELDGIGGLIIGHLFRMPDELLPRGYKSEKGIGRRLGYIVTGISHSIKNDWLTRIEAQTIILEEPDGMEYNIFNLLLGSGTLNESNQASTRISINNGGIIMSNAINPNTVGSQAYPINNIPEGTGKPGHLNVAALVSIGPSIQHTDTYKRYGYRYLLQPQAANAFKQLQAAAKAEGHNIDVSCAYRDTVHNESVGGAAASAHLAAGAIDIGSLFALVNGSTNPAINAKARANSSLYKWMSVNAPKFGWYNPYRLKDTSGMDELWHWEYWGYFVK